MEEEWGRSPRAAGRCSITRLPSFGTSILRRVRIFPARALAKRASSRTLNVWCSAVSSGQEVYSIAMLLLEHFPSLAGWNVRFLASDVSESVLGGRDRAVRDRGESGPGEAPREALRARGNAVADRRAGVSHVSSSGPSTWRVWPASSPWTVFRKRSPLFRHGHAPRCCAKCRSLRPTAICSWAAGRPAHIGPIVRVGARREGDVLPAAR